MEIDLDLPLFQSIAVQDPSQPGEARRAAAKMASSLGFDEVKCGKVEVIVTELGGNIIKHGGGGHIILSGWKTHKENRIVVLALDKGPGIRNVGKALEDGYSTVGTLGTGLGAVRRMSDSFDLFTQDTGTIVFSEINSKSAVDRKEAVGGISIPISGETVCGDAFAIHSSSQRHLFMVVDGLGHGPLANEAATAALEVFYKWTNASPHQLIERLHGALKSTRGAAVAIAEVMPQREQLIYCGLGNIVGVIINPVDNLARSMVSHNGVVGHQMGRCAEFSYPWANDSALVMHSDGLSGRWNHKTYPGLINKPPAVIAGALYRDYARVRDDATVLVAKPGSHPFKAA